MVVCTAISKQGSEEQAVEILISRWMDFCAIMKKMIKEKNAQTYACRIHISQLTRSDRPFHPGHADRQEAARAHHEACSQAVEIFTLSS